MFQMIPDTVTPFMIKWFALAVCGLVILLSCYGNRLGMPSPSGGMRFLAITIASIVIIVAIYVNGKIAITKFALTDQGLKITGSYGRFISKEAFVKEGVRAVDLTRETQYLPVGRENGVNYPGYFGGWWRLKNREKGLLFLTDKSSVVYLPTTRNYSVLISLNDPQLFLDRMNDLW